MAYKLGRIFFNNFKKIVPGDYKLSCIALKLRHCEQLLTLSKFLFHSQRPPRPQKGPMGLFWKIVILPLVLFWNKFGFLLALYHQGKIFRISFSSILWINILNFRRFNYPTSILNIGLILQILLLCQMPILIEKIETFFSSLLPILLFKPFY